MPVVSSALKERLAQDLKECLKSRDTLRKDMVQIVRAGVLQAEKDGQVTLDDAGVTEVISRELKKRYDVMPDYERSGRQDSLENLNRQIAILKEYLPEQLSPDEVSAIILDAVNESGAASMKDMGKVMQLVSPKVKGRADGKTVAALVRKLLSEKQ
ncbi:MAG: GatB/YqeY domain-containing protein [Clostridiales bacterium]|jgi:uncharacterized protein YqeY|nr:GatB/YqeY domain-containing protein [Clostridiales bacterium]